MHDQSISRFFAEISSCGSYGEWCLEVFGSYDKNDAVVKKSWRGTEDRFFSVNEKEGGMQMIVNSLLKGDKKK